MITIVGKAADKIHREEDVNALLIWVMAMFDYFEIVNSFSTFGND